MVKEHRIVAVIPARGGSKSVPKKNIRPLGGKPLIVWSIETARQVAEIDRVIVSTDDVEIGEIARLHGAETYMRPAHLATDEALVIDALKDLIRSLKKEGETAEIMVLLEPTCPFRSGEDVLNCIEFVAGGYDSAATFKEAELNPHRAWRIIDGRPEVFVEGAIPWMPRQKLPKAYQLNGAVYAFRVDLLESHERALLFGKCGAVIMPEERSVDIDGPTDFMVADSILSGKK